MFSFVSGVFISISGRFIHLAAEGCRRANKDMLQETGNHITLQNDRNDEVWNRIFRKAGRKWKQDLSGPRMRQETGTGQDDEDSRKAAGEQEWMVIRGWEGNVSS